MDFNEKIYKKKLITKCLTCLPRASAESGILVGDYETTSVEISHIRSEGSEFSRTPTLLSATIFFSTVGRSPVGCSAWQNGGLRYQ